MLAGLEGGDSVKCSRGVVVVPDTSLDSALSNGPYDAVILPGGGGGAKALAESAKVLLGGSLNRILIYLLSSLNPMSYTFFAHVFFSKKNRV